jgi:hypothetical protein
VVVIDLLGTGTTTRNGNKYMLVMVDLLSKWPEAIPIPDKEASTVARAFVNGCVARHGCPEIVISDQGSEFTNEMMTTIFKNMGIQANRTLSYHPQSNGCCERMNRSIIQMLSKYSDENGTNWDENIELILFAYRVAPHSSTGIPPFEFNKGKMARLPSSSWFIHPPVLHYSDKEDYLAELKRTLVMFNQIAHENLSQSKNQQTFQYNKTAREHPFEIGMKVLCRDPQDQSNKLGIQWSGPFKILDLKRTKAVLRLWADELAPSRGKCRQIVYFSRIGSRPVLFRF